ncbi:hypothetical protein BU25DRAFT_414349 [Macroventuria anomochaeta]|uniref:Uncharacterized protein n=1 Tax=Macroventuria anomochaeta TaxID=301207 RepID=A0ACB6RR03_9PLEO|nr:uncharacterized protein BU25DRAFT_414349 [Macroventuria anomochaeta]KAF2623334.1 hypothetical protein BU25DRAFT_414349 [Macroventuria anomochaeta]
MAVLKKREVSLEFVTEQDVPQMRMRLMLMNGSHRVVCDRLSGSGGERFLLEGSCVLVRAQWMASEILYYACAVARLDEWTMSVLGMFVLPTLRGGFEWEVCSGGCRVARRCAVTGVSFLVDGGFSSGVQCGCSFNGNVVCELCFEMREEGRRWYVAP